MLSLKMDALRRYEYIPGVGGVNFAEVDEPVKRVIGGSGRSLLVQVYENRVVVSDHSGWSGRTKIFMSAVADDSEMRFGLFVRKFVYQTGEFGPKHPDLFPVLFAQCVVAFFDQNLKKPVNTLRQDWGSESVSAWQYWKFRTRDKPISKTEAAKMTSGGKMAGILGFSTLIGEVDESLGANVVVTWSRDSK